ncbi:hypothetical protein A2997_01540 [Candidatus Nomurabacteria bacterium RIFCSPLOWO2_01_FULL_36_10b]|uniref:Penicillin-binding protein 2 n=1 Tax=Candidatus Nomurabacteria bacterium RIFCSPLOWO2_01_FULL_36_10b TaxID=1801766 RepID=A0A1F6WNC9_9BACT|nr:MAG: hypothetical protein A2997_01540 [Candidatus Nomurabacteria bacterium RIFCSPLOWO2_01_FULL_36_10b]
MRRSYFTKHAKHAEISPDEIFLDSSNVSSFDEQQLEGFIERPLPKRIFILVGLIVITVLFLFFVQLIRLQVFQGHEYARLAENNRVNRITLFSERGIIYDRFNVKLAWNEESENSEPFSRREYINKEGFGHLLGYISYPKKDSNNIYWQDSIIGREGVEHIFNKQLQGIHGAILQETDARSNSTSVVGMINPEPGDNITLSIDSRIQSALAESIEYMVEQFDYKAGSGIIMDIHTGEIIAITNVPEYNPMILSEGIDTTRIKEYLTSKSGYFINRAISGLYTPGSIIKPFIALAALQEEAINEWTTILSTGQIEVPNPYDKNKPSIYRDWKSDGHGVVGVKDALANSVNTFFYAIVGGYRGQKGIGIDVLNKYVELFEIGSSTKSIFPHEADGTIPSPKWKKKVFNEPWRLGDTYITAIGQFGFQVTPIQMVRATSAIANGGILLIPHIIAGETTVSQIISGINPNNYNIVREGMRKTVTGGTATVLNISNPHIAAKTGTAQVGALRNQVNSWVIGFYPYEDPQYAFTVVMEKGPSVGIVGASWAIRHMFDILAVLP